MTIEEILSKLERRIKKASESEDGEEFFSHLYYALSFQPLVARVLASGKNSDFEDRFDQLSAELGMLVTPSAEVD